MEKGSNWVLPMHTYEHILVAFYFRPVGEHYVLLYIKSTVWGQMVTANTLEHIPRTHIEARPHGPVEAGQFEWFSLTPHWRKEMEQIQIWFRYTIHPNKQRKVMHKRAKSTAKSTCSHLLWLLLCGVRYAWCVWVCSVVLHVQFAWATACVRWMATNKE